MMKILVVEDDLSTYEFIAAVLQARGYRLRHTTDGSRVHSLVREWEPDLILLDVMLPFMDGYTVQLQLLEDPKTQTIPILIMTSKVKIEEVFASAANVKGFFAKPFNMRELSEKIGEVLTQKK